MIRTASALASYPKLVDPDSLSEEQRENVLASLLEAGGPLVALNAAAGQFTFKTSPIGTSIEQNRSRKAFDVFLFPTNEARALKQEWDAAASINDWKARRSRVFTGGFLNYAYLRPYFVQTLESKQFEPFRDQLGIAIRPDGTLGQSPVSWLAENLVPAPFLNWKEPVHSPIWLHRFLADKLVAIERDLPDPKPVLRLFGGFNPRLINPGGTDLSNHSFGLGFDIDWDANPFLKVQHFVYLAEFLPLARKICDELIMCKPEKPPKSKKAVSYKRSQALCNDFRAYMQTIDQAIVLGQQDVVLRQQEIDTRHRAAARDLAASYLAGGFLTIPLDLVQCMYRHEVGWGGYYKGNCDYMHFEYPLLAPNIDKE